MCLSDIVLPWMTTPSFDQFMSVESGVFECVPADPWRVALVIQSANTLQQLNLFPGKTASLPAQSLGFNLDWRNPPLVLSARDHGALVTAPWYANFTDSDQGVTWSAASVSERYRKLLQDTIDKTLKGGADGFLAAMLRPNTDFAIPGLIPGG